MSRHAGYRELGIAGWLFAEVAMVLVIVVMGSETSKTGHQPEPPRIAAAPPTSSHPQPSRSPSAQPSPASPSPSAQAGLSLRSVDFVMPVATWGRELRAVFLRGMVKAVGKKAQIGMVQLFSRSRDLADPVGTGIALSERVKRAIDNTGIAQFLPHMEIRTFFAGSSLPTNHARVELFMVVQVR